MLMASRQEERDIDFLFKRASEVTWRHVCALREQPQLRDPAVFEEFLLQEHDAADTGAYERSLTQQQQPTDGASKPDPGATTGGTSSARRRRTEVPQRA